MGLPHLAGQDAACSDRQVDCETSQGGEGQGQGGNSAKHGEERESRATSVCFERLIYNIHTLDQLNKVDLLSSFFVLLL